jgi:SAM-dependent methyltransferase
MSSKLKLNLGCGTGKIEGFVNIDIDPALEPDKVFDIRNELPLEDNSAELVVMYHTIEHIHKPHWQGIFLDVSRILVEGGEFWISFPEFGKCWENWKTNRRGLREFWEATIYGRGSSPYDNHVSVADTDEIIYLLTRSGFEITYQGSEQGGQDYNTLLKCTNLKALTYEEVLRDRLWPEHKSQNE